MTVSLSGIYIIANIPTGKFYIGSSIHVENRLRQHRFQLNKGNHCNAHLRHAWQKYGPSSFIVMKLEVCEPTKEALLTLEQHYLDTLKPQYNMCPRAGSRLGSKASEETKRKMSATMKGRPGHPVSDETRAKLSARVYTDEWRRNIGNGARGRIPSKQQRDKVAAAIKGIKRNQTSIDKTQRGKCENRLRKIAEKNAVRETRPIVKNDVRYALRRLNEDQVRDIRNSMLTDKEVAAKYNCTPGAIAKIRKFKTYKDVI